MSSRFWKKLLDLLFWAVGIQYRLTDFVFDPIERVLMRHYRQAIVRERLRSEIAWRAQWE